MPNIEQSVKKIMAKVFKMPVDEINAETAPHTVSKWDSMQHLKMILELEKHFKIHFDEDEIPTLVNYKIIISTVSAYLD